MTQEPLPDEFPLTPKERLQEAWWVETSYRLCVMSAALHAVHNGGCAIQARKATSRQWEERDVQGPNWDWDNWDFRIAPTPETP